jgi:hypothetical protein
MIVNLKQWARWRTEETSLPKMLLDDSFNQLNRKSLMP